MFISEVFYSPSGNIVMAGNDGIEQCGEEAACRHLSLFNKLVA
jgi:hypothetical protein